MWLLFVYLMAANAGSNPVQGVGRAMPPVVQYPVIRTTEPNNHCGLYSLLAAANSVGHTISVGELISGEYISSPRGSTVLDLQRASEHFDLPTTTLYGLGVEGLRQSAFPLLLQLTSGDQEEGTYHWVTFLGDAAGRAVIYDTAKGLKRMAYSELMIRWDGTGILVGPARAGVEVATVSQLARLNYCWPPFLLVLFIALCKRVFSSGTPYSRLEQSPLARAAVVATFVLIWVSLDLATDKSHPVRNLDLIRTMSCRLASSDAIPSMTTPTIPTDAIVVDVRLPLAYAYDHIDGAINVPVDSDLGELNDFLRSVDATRIIVVYCQNARCGWAAKMSARFQCLGRDSRVLTGGIDGYRRRSFKTARTTQNRAGYLNAPHNNMQ